MKKQFFIMPVLAMAVLASCEQENFSEINEGVSNELDNNSSMVSGIQLSSVAYMLSDLSFDINVCNEVHGAVTDALRCGLDESYYFHEILDGRENKIATKSYDNSGLGAIIYDYLSSIQTKSTDAGLIDADLLMNSDIQIYWPYSENWDGVSMPAITFAPEDESQDWNYAYVMDNGKIDTIVVNEEYMEQHPVWIINKSDIPYDALPNFVNGEFVKNNVAYIRSAENSDEEFPTFVPQTKSGEPVYTVYLGKMMSEKQHDSVWSGGSEFVVQCGAVGDLQITNENQLTSSNIKVTTMTVLLSRKDIKNKKWKTMNSILVSNWYPNELNAAFMVHEDDNSGEIHVEKFTLSVKLGKIFSINIDLKRQMQDDYIYKTVYDRNFIFSTNNNLGNGNWAVNTSRGVYWTTPYKIGFTII